MAYDRGTDDSDYKRTEDGTKVQLPVYDESAAFDSPFDATTGAFTELPYTLTPPRRLGRSVTVEELRAYNQTLEQAYKLWNQAFDAYGNEEAYAQYKEKYGEDGGFGLIAPHPMEVADNVQSAKIDERHAAEAARSDEATANASEPGYRKPDEELTDREIELLATVARSFTQQAAYQQRRRNFRA